MKVVIINKSDSTGGAAIAANRLMKSLHNYKIDSKMIVCDKRFTDSNVFSLKTSFIRRLLYIFFFIIERIVIIVNNRWDRNKLFQVSIANTGLNISNHPLIKESDILHLHWINQGFLSLSNIKKLIQTGKPMIWTMHDMWLCTGICHHAWECERYKEECGKCQFLNSKKAKDLSYKTLIKKRFLSKSSIHIVTVSSWLKKIAENSSLIKDMNISVIPNVIDTSIFHPSDKTEARKALSLSLDKKIILMGAARLNDPIKGFKYLKEALSTLVITFKSEDILLVLFGSIKKEPSFLSDLAVDHIYMGSISDMFKIAQLYIAADVTVVPSYYETFGQTLIEAMACGCPVVSFDNSGQTDIIDHKKNGYLAKYRDSVDLAKGIKWILDNTNEAMRDACREKVVLNYSEKVVANKYISLYKSLLNNES